MAPKHQDVHGRALRLLAVRSRSRGELEARLLRTGFDPSDVECELERLEEVGLVDDDAFARDIVRHHLTVRRSGRRAVARALAAKRVPTSTIEAALAELTGEEEDERAESLARDRAASLSGIGPEKAYGRLVGFLARRGYDGPTARHAARVALGVEIDDR